MAAVACSDDNTSPATFTPVNNGVAGKSAGAAGSAGAQTAGSNSGGTGSGGTPSMGGTPSTGGTTVSAGNGGLSGGGTTGEPKAGSANGGAGGDAGAAGMAGAGEGGGSLGGQGGAGGQTGDAGSGGDGGAGGDAPEPNKCVVASYGEVQPTSSSAIYNLDDEVMTLTLKLQDGTPRDEVEVTMYDGRGTFNAGIKEGTYEIAGDNLDYKYCTLCVLLYDQVNQFGGNRGWYMATGGSVTLTSVEGNLTGSLSNVTFQHVYEDNGGHSVPWADGCTTSVKGLGFDTEIVEE